MFLALTLLVALLQAAPSPDKAATPLALDFILTSSDGDAPGGLTPADVTLKVGGKVRPVLNLELLPDTTPHQIVLLVDEPTLYNLEKPAKDAIHKLLATVRPGDRVTYVTTRGGRSLEPGKDAAAKAADTMVTGPGVLYSCLDDLMTTIQTFVKRMPKGRMGFLAVVARGHPEGPTLDPDAAGGCTPHRDATRETEEAVAASQVNVQLFTVSETNSSWGLDTLASNIGARTGLITFNNTNALERALNEKRRHYRATIAADPTAPQRPQRVELKVNAKNVKVRTSATLVINPAHVGTR